MNTIDTVINIERSKLKEIQSSMDKYISNLKKYSNKINSNQLVDILVLNQEIDNIINLITENNMKIFKDNKSSLTKKNKLELETFDNNNKIFKKYMPFMLLDSINSN